jgi:hypothetical protein
MSATSWTKELERELCNIELAFVWMKQHECNLREILKI